MKPFKLEDFPKIETGFKTPDGFFDDFPDQMLKQVLPGETRVVLMHRKRTKWIYAVAAVLVLALSLPMLNEITGDNQPLEAEIEQYFAHQHISEEIIVSLLEDEDISNLKIDYQLEDKSIEEALPADIENYITD